MTPIPIEDIPTLIQYPYSNVSVKSHIIQPDSATTDSDPETIHFKWSWDSNVLFPTYHNEAFEATIHHLQNLTAISVKTINAVMADVMAKSHSDNKAVQYFKNLKNIKNSDTDLT